MDWQAAAQLLVRACSPRSYRRWGAVDEDIDGEDLLLEGPPGGVGDSSVCRPVWEPAVEQECNECLAATPRRCVRSSARPDLGRRELALAGPAAWRPVVMGSVERGQ